MQELKCPLCGGVGWSIGLDISTIKIECRTTDCGFNTAINRNQFGTRIGKIATLTQKNN